MAGNDKIVYDSGATKPENDRTAYEGDKTKYEGAAAVPESGSKTIFDNGTTMLDTVLSDAAAQGVSAAPADNTAIQNGETILDTYTVESDAIEGGMGSVWRVHHKGWNVDLAMKRPQPKCFSTEKSKADFIHECEAWINLGLHPNIVSCYYVREISGTPTIFSEWMDGGSLEGAINNGTLYEGTEAKQQERILDIAIQFARGLHYAHEAGLIHQDVKPDNLLLTKEGEAKVADFGLAKARAVLTVLEGDPTMTNAPTDSGKTIASPSGGYTPAYCSMEQMDGKELTRRTDIYSWAVSVMEMYIGSRPWANGVVAGLGCRGYFENTRVPMPEALKALLAQCLAPEPDDRPHDFAEVEAKLHKIYKAETGSDYPRPAPKAAADTADSLNNRALSMLDLGKIEEAKVCWANALKQNPDHLNSAYNAVLLAWKLAEIDDLDALKRLRKYDDGSVQAMLYQAYVQIARADEAAFACADLLEKRRMEPGALAELRQLIAQKCRSETVVWESDNVDEPLTANQSGNLVWVAEDDQHVHIIEPLTNSILAEYHHPRAIKNAIFDPEGRLLALCGDGISVWDLREQRLVFRHIEEHMNYARFQADAASVITIADPPRSVYYVRVFNLMRGVEMDSYPIVYTNNKLCRKADASAAVEQQANQTDYYPQTCAYVICEAIANGTHDEFIPPFYQFQHQPQTIDHLLFDQVVYTTQIYYPDRYEWKGVCRYCRKGTGQVLRTNTPCAHWHYRMLNSQYAWRYYRKINNEGVAPSRMSVCVLPLPDPAFQPAMAISRIESIHKRNETDVLASEYLKNAEAAFRREAYDEAISWIDKRLELVGYEHSDVALELRRRIGRHCRKAGVLRTLRVNQVDETMLVIRDNSVQTAALRREAEAAYSNAANGIPLYGVYHTARAELLMLTGWDARSVEDPRYGDTHSSEEYAVALFDTARGKLTMFPSIGRVPQNMHEAYPYTLGALALERFDLLITATEDSDMVLWSIRDGRRLKTLPIRAKALYPLSNDQFFIAFSARRIALLEVPAGRIVWELEESFEYHYTPRFIPNEDIFVLPLSKGGNAAFEILWRFQPENAP